MTVAQDQVISPSRFVFANVIYDEVPEQPPDDLVAFLRRTDPDDPLRGWKLTEDAIAFGDRELVARMAAWQETFMKSWPLGQRSMLRLLRDLVQDEMDTLTERGRHLLDTLCGHRPELVGARIDVESFVHLDTVLQSVRSMINQAGRLGFGVIDTTPGSNRTGLLRAWSCALGGHVLAADPSCTVSIGHDGLRVEPGAGQPAISEIQEVSFTGDEVSLVTPNDVTDLPSTAVAPLAWLIPEATSWRIRSVPESVVWADTFAGVADGCDFAARHVADAILDHDGVPVAV